VEDAEARCERQIGSLFIQTYMQPSRPADVDKSRLEGGPSYADNDVGIWVDRRSADVDTYYGTDRDVSVAPGVSPGLGAMGTR
jgi:hypothetical protein